MKLSKLGGTALVSVSMAIGTPEGNASAQTNPETGITQNQTMREFLRNGIEDTSYGKALRKAIVHWFLMNVCGEGQNNNKCFTPAKAGEVLFHHWEYDLYSLLGLATAMRSESDWQLGSEIRKQEVTLDEAIIVVYEEIKQFAIDNGFEEIKNEDIISRTKCETCRKATQVLERREKRQLTKTSIDLQIKEFETKMDDIHTNFDKIFYILNELLSQAEKEKLTAYNIAMKDYEQYRANKEKLINQLQLMGFDQFGFNDDGELTISQEDPRYLRHLNQDVSKELYFNLTKYTQEYSQAHKQYQTSAHALFTKLETLGQINIQIDSFLEQRDLSVKKLNEKISELKNRKVY